MRFFQLLLASTAVTVASASFATYKLIRNGVDDSGNEWDNSNEVAYRPLTRSDTLFLYIQIVAGSDDSALIADFKELARNYGNEGIKAIPRVRYGLPTGAETGEPTDLELIMDDVGRWADVFEEVNGDLIDIPVIQAGFLGLWGEWHGGHFCPGKGIYETDDNIEAKGRVANRLLQTDIKVALRYPQDHEVLGFEGNRSVTIHNDCILASGPDGVDGGTFPEEDIKKYKDYVKREASGNTYGGEPCNQAEGANYDWDNYADICGDNGLITYINEFEIAYLNPANPTQLRDMFSDPEWSDCIDRMGAALDKYV